MKDLDYTKWAEDAKKYAREWETRGEALEKTDSLLAGFANAIGRLQWIFAARAAEVARKNKAEAARKNETEAAKKNEAKEAP